MKLSIPSSHLISSWRRYIRLVLSLAFLCTCLTAHPAQADSPVGDHAQRSPDQTEMTVNSDDSHFVANTGYDLDRYLYRADVTGGKLTYYIPITRYYFNTADRKVQFTSDGYLTSSALTHVKEKKILPETATLKMWVYDVDETDPECAEVDWVYVNGQRLVINGRQAQLSGADDTWSSFSAQVPIQMLKFPQAKGNQMQLPTPANNKIEIEIDVNCQTAWAVEVDWGMLEIQSPIRPIIFVHGWTGTPENTFKKMDEEWLVEDGIPSGGRVDLYDGIYPIDQSASWLTSYIYQRRIEFGVDKINLFAHSKGGLVARRALETPLVANSTQNLATFASPHHGTIFAESEQIMLWLCDHIKYPGDPIKAKLCFEATKEFRIGTMMSFNYTGCRYDWLWGWVDCKPKSWKQSGVNYYSFTASLDEAVRPVESTTYPWNSWPPFPQVLITDAAFLSTHGGLLENKNAYDCAIYHLDSARKNGLGCLLTADVSSLDLQGQNATEEEQTILLSQGSLAGAGEYTEYALVNQSSEGTFMIFSTQPISFTLQTPGGKIINPAVAANDSQIEYSEQNVYGLQQYGYQVTSPQIGSWTLHVHSSNAADFYFWATAVSASSMHVATYQPSYQPGQVVQFSAALSTNGSLQTGASVGGIVYLPDNTSLGVNLYDDGTNGDPTANDGVYTGQFTAPDVQGNLIVAVEGQKDNLQRYLELAVPVAIPTAAITGSLASDPVDTNGNGFWDALNFPVQVEVFQSGHFALEGVLVDKTGEIIANANYDSRQANNGNPLSTGLNILNLTFSSQAFIEHGIDGPYTLTRLQLRKTDSFALPIGYANDLYTTPGYLLSQFEQPLFSFVSGADEGQDTNGDGRYNRLHIRMQVKTLQTGTHEVTGRLVNAQHREAAWTSQTFYASAPGLYTVDLYFSGSEIGNSQIDGPYLLTDFSILNQNTAGYVLLDDIYTTKVYRFIQFEGAAYRIYSPIILANSGGSNTTPLTGQVTQDGLPIAGIQVELRYDNGSGFSTFDSTYTDSNGNYTFTSPPELQLYQTMYVRYINPESNPDRLTHWACNEIDSTTDSADARHCDFDIKNIILFTPVHTARVTLPTMFWWGTRGLSGDDYELNIENMLNGSPWWWTNPSLGYTDNYTLNTLPTDFYLDTTYGWYMWVYTPNGYGISYYYHEITFTMSSAFQQGTDQQKPVPEYLEERIEEHLHSKP